MGIPENMSEIPWLTGETLSARLRSAHHFLLLDVREPWEMDGAHIADHRLAVAPPSVSGGIVEYARKVDPSV